MQIFLGFFNFNKILCDAPDHFQIGLQDPATPIAEGILNFHNHLFAFLLGIAFFVFYLLFRCITLFHESKHPIASKLLHNSVLEITWTLIPALILIFIAIPSFSLLYAADELIDPFTTVKVIGHQWYWSYELNDYMEWGALDFDSYMLPENELPLGFFRNLEVDNRLIVPIEVRIRFLITSLDVIHCWVVPSLGIKADATPGRLLQVPCFIKRSSVFYGQCSEICGINHAFMPIVVVGLNFFEHVLYILAKIETLLEPTWVVIGGGSSNSNTSSTEVASVKMKKN